MGRDVVYSDHAIEQMAARGISKVEVRLVLNNPDTTAPGEIGATNAWRLLDGRTVRVTYSATVEGRGKNKKTTIVVITAAIKEKA